MSNEKEYKKSSTAEQEERILSFWDDQNIFEKSLAKDSPKGDFVFYDGPPFATGLPHYGHLLAGTIKDIIPRYKTMQGYHVPRKWGWDCHGLPIENLIEKELGLSTKKDIEDYGIEAFNVAARNSVLRYEKEWKRYVPRSGRFIDMENAYIAMDPEYMESIWWVFSELYKKDFVKEGFKAMHLCPRCETTLSNFEVNQGYKDVTDITVTAKFELKNEKNTYFLAWTTTPWTLPGNVALAVGPDIQYVKVLCDNEYYIVGKDLLEKIFVGKEYSLVSEMKGLDLVGKEYFAPFNFYQKDTNIENNHNGWKVLNADFVTTEDGTGIVHIAPAFGSDDMQLGQEHDLPFVQHVSKSGAFKHIFAKTVDDGDFAGMLVKQKNDLMSTDIEIIKRLAHDGKLFAKEKVVHSYPHCWRCDTPLLNYATSSWSIDVPRIKEALVKKNQNIHWVPDHVGSGRFGKWLEGAREWAFSRSRFWGTPIPLWYNPATEKHIAFSSYDEMLSCVKKSGNFYYTLRHGESESNLDGSINFDVSTQNGLTEKGKKQVDEALDQLVDKDIDIIIASPLQRTRETAERIARGLNIDIQNIIFDDRLVEIQAGKDFEGKTWEEYHKKLKSFGRDFFDKKATNDSESMEDVYIRSMKFLFDIEKKYQNKKILIVSHGGILRWMQFGVEKRGLVKYAYDFFYNANFVKNADVLKLDFVSFPHRKEMVIDIHKPYIDDIEIEQDGVALTRISEVFDVWFDSGCMPYAQQHYPFENKESFDKVFPAQFIAEGLDQTRGWFYVLSVLGTILFDKIPFENVVVNGLILAEDGKKMSKSLKNYPDPYYLFDTVGADAVRFYMTKSPVVRAEEFAFSEKGAREVASKLMGRLRNTMNLYELYASIPHSSHNHSGSKLDKYVLTLVEKMQNDVSKNLELYRLDLSAQAIFDFVDLFSTRYIRWTRDRFKGNNEQDKLNALSTTRFVFEKILKVIAPFVPFVAEELWQVLRKRDKSLEESVHLCEWPKHQEFSEEIIKKFDALQEQITELLRLRTEAKINVRKPLPSATVSLENTLHQDFQDILKKEINVKEILFGSKPVLDLEMTQDLIDEGNMREFLRSLQSLRKKSGLQAGDSIELFIYSDEKGEFLVQKFEDEIKKTANISRIIWKENNGEVISVSSDLSFEISIV